LPEGFRQAGAYEDRRILRVGYVDPERGLDAGQLGIDQSFAEARDVSNLDTCLMEPGDFESYSDRYYAECVPVVGGGRRTNLSADNALPADTRAVLLRLGEGGHETLIVHVPDGNNSDRSEDVTLEISRPGATPLPDDPARMLVSLRALSKHRAEQRLCGYSYNTCYRTPESGV
jgi:hypothetical protein